MRIVKKSIIASAIILSTTVSADMLSGGFDTSFVKVAPGHFKSQTTSGYTGGAMRIRWGDTGAVAVANIQPPHMSVGCDGIDIGFGSFSFLNPEVFIEKAKAIASAAPAFAFKMALSTLCKECDTIMQELEAALNAINSISMDSCGIAQNLGGALGKEIGESIRGGDSEDYMAEYRGTFSDPNGAFQQWAGKIKGWAGGDIIKADKTTMRGSIVRRGMDSYSGFAGLSANKEDIAALFVAMYGDIYGYSSEEFKWQAGGFAKPDVLIQYMLTPNVSTITNFGATLLKIPVDSKTGDVYEKPGEYQQIPIKTLFPVSMVDLITNKINGIRNKIQANQALNAQDIQFLDSLDEPLWKALNIEIYKNKIGEPGDIVTDVAIQRISLEQTKALFRFFSQAFSKMVSMEIANLDEKVATPHVIDMAKAYLADVNLKNKEIATALDQYKFEFGEDDKVKNRIKQFEDQFKRDAVSKFAGRGW